MVRRVRSKISDRPAETASIVAAIVGVLGIVGFHVSDEQAGAVVAVVGLVASFVTFVVNRFGGE